MTSTLIGDISNYDYDVDINNPDAWLAAYKAYGMEGVIIGSQWPYKAYWQLAQCQKNDMPVVATYAEPNWTTAIQLASDAHCSTVCIAIEPGGIRDASTLHRAVSDIRAAGMTPKLYGNEGDVLAVATVEQFGDVELWMAGYWNDERKIASVDWWPKVWAHQFTSTTKIAGKNRDISMLFNSAEGELSVEDKLMLNILANIVVRHGMRITRTEEVDSVLAGANVTIKWSDYKVQDDGSYLVFGDDCLLFSQAMGYSFALGLQNAQQSIAQLASAPGAGAALQLSDADITAIVTKMGEHIANG